MTNLWDKTKKTIKVLALAGAGVAAFALPAFAADAEAKTAANVRSGPGTNYAVVDTLYAGEDVDITQCTSSGKWCYVTHSGPDGWVHTSLLQPVGGSGSGSGSTSNNCNFHIGPSGFKLECDGSSITLPIPGTPPTPKKVCVYNGSNYTGASVCVTAGTSDPNLTGFWNNRITSLKVFGGAKVQLCQNPGYGGFCNTFSSNVPHLGFALNNKASSYKTW